MTKQVEAGRPIVETVGDIQETIGDSQFVRGVGSGVQTAARETPEIVSNSISLAHNSARVRSSFYI